MQTATSRQAMLVINDHYHMAIKLSKQARWIQVRNFLDEKYGT